MIARNKITTKSIRAVKIPKESVIGREVEFNKIKEIILYSLKSKNSSLLYISGVPGSGKTYTVNAVIADIQKLLHSNENNNKISVSFVNCSTLKIKRDIYGKILSTINLSRQCFSSQLKSLNLQSLRLHLNSCPAFHLIIVDEVDFILTKNESYLYNLLELVNMKSSIFLIFLSNTLGTLSTKLESRIGWNRLEFKPYTSNQLSKIIEASSNVNKSLAQDKIGDYKKSNKKATLSQPSSTKILNFLGKKVASGTGDIRRLSLLLQSSYGSFQDVNEKIKRINQPLICKIIQFLNKTQKAILGTLNNEEGLTIVESYNTYKSKCKINLIDPLLMVDFYKFKDSIIELSNMGFFKLNKAATKIIGATFDKEEVIDQIKNDNLLYKLIIK